ncbi:hypothetical protein PEBR_10695 [Penicillium brasilianum]|uniref:Uncharacterized protein n=1 Tax=Penicillium brasilianum TaxID=104259 RepID=A0A1S9RUP9_PENBI|nr:hypothetical protein PEBR_10695 [Penicillium brasilianum]
MYVDDKPNATCSDNGYDKAVAVEVSFLNSLSDDFRKADSEKERQMTLAGNDISSEAYKEYTFDFSYTPPRM